MYESSAGSSTGGDTAVLGEEVVGVPSTPAVGEEQTALAALVKVKARDVPGTDPLVLHLGALVCKQRRVRGEKVIIRDIPGRVMTC